MNDEFAYIGREPCGAITGATIDNPDHAKYVRKDVQDFMRSGRTVERVKVEVVRSEMSVCPKIPFFRWNYTACAKGCPLVKFEEVKRG